MIMAEGYGLIDEKVDIGKNETDNFIIVQFAICSYQVKINC